MLTTWKENREKKTASFHCIGKVSFPPRVGQWGLSPEKTKSIVVLWLSRYDVSYVIVDEALFQCVYMVDVLFYVFLWFWSAVSISSTANLFFYPQYIKGVALKRVCRSPLTSSTNLRIKCIHAPTSGCEAKSRLTKIQKLMLYFLSSVCIKLTSQPSTRGWMPTNRTKLELRKA